MRTFREYLQIVLNEEDAPPPGGPPDLGGGGPPPGGPPDLGGGGPPPGGPPPDLGGMPGAAPAGGQPKTKLDVYEVWRDLEDYLKNKLPKPK